MIKLWLKDDYDSTNEALKLMLDINTECANTYCAMAYPGSARYEMAIQEGWFLPDSWQGYSQYAYESLFLPMKHFGSSEVLSFRDSTINTYFESLDI